MQDESVLWWNSINLEQSSREERSWLYATSAADENFSSFADLEAVEMVCRTMARCIILTYIIDREKNINTPQFLPRLKSWASLRMKR